MRAIASLLAHEFNFERRETLKLSACRGTLLAFCALLLCRSERCGTASVQHHSDRCRRRRVCRHRQLRQRNPNAKRRCTGPGRFAFHTVRRKRHIPPASIPRPRNAVGVIEVPIRAGTRQGPMRCGKDARRCGIAAAQCLDLKQSLTHMPAFISSGYTLTCSHPPFLCQRWTTLTLPSAIK